MFHRILVPLDGSPLGEHALPLAITLAGSGSGRLVLAHVYEQFKASMLIPPPNETDARQQSQNYLDATSRSILQKTGTQAHTSLLEGDISEQLEQFAVEENVDLVVMTTHGRGLFSRFWLGSIADDLLRRLPIPMILVRPADSPVDVSRRWMPRHIVIALDGSEYSEAVLEPAASIAQLAPAKCTLVQVVEPWIGIDQGAFEVGGGGGNVALMAEMEAVRQQLEERAEAYLKQQAERLREQGLEVDTRVVSDHRIAHAVLALAHETAADLVALSSHGHGGLTRLVLGSVADKVVRGADLPVLVARRPADT